MRKLVKSLVICALVAVSFLWTASCSGNNTNYLTAQEWALEEITHKDSSAAIIIPGKIAISFSDSSMVYGNAGCNRFFARYQTDKSGKITINPPGATMMWCMNMPFENAYLKMIELADSYTVGKDKLVIQGADNAFTLTYRPLEAGDAAQTPSPEPLGMEQVHELEMDVLEGPAHSGAESPAVSAPKSPEAVK